MDVMIAATELAIGYNGKKIADGVSLSAGSGDVLCLLGPNGSGKTTLFKTLLGLIPAISGHVDVCGKPLATLSRAAVARNIAYVPQAHAAPFAFTSLEVVLMGRTAHLGPFEQPGPDDHDTALRALSRVGIEDLATADYTRLSGGQRQLVLIARALAQGAPVLIMDEPTASLDFGNQMRVLTEVTRLANDGLTVILSTHDPDHAFAVGTQVVLLHDGKVIGNGPPDAILTAATLSEVYGIAVNVERLPDGRAVCVPGIPSR